jgi:hypothetical protein
MNAMRQFSLNGQVEPLSFTFAGLNRRLDNDMSAAQVRRNGLVIMNERIPIREVPGEAPRFYPESIDEFLRVFIQRAAHVYDQSPANGPYLLTMMFRAGKRMMGSYPGIIPGTEDDAIPIEVGDYRFPTMQADNFIEIDRTMRPLCDQAHQTFGRRASPFFNLDGVWRAPQR